MPCLDNYSSQDDFRRQSAVSQNAELKDRLDAVTALLCASLHHLDDHETDIHGLTENVPGLKAWWSEHQRLDAIRERKERAAVRRRAQRAAKKSKEFDVRLEALSKLTFAEKKVLGLV